MVNMYSMGMMGYGMNPMYNMYGMNSMYGMYGSGVNVHQQLKQRYGVGNEDFGTRPYAQPYPFPIVPRRQEAPCFENSFCRFFKKFFS